MNVVQGSDAGGAARIGIVSILSQRSVASILGVVLVVMLGLGMVFPIVPLYARSFGVSLAAVGLFISTFGITRLVFDLVGGVVVDRLGEKVVIIGGLGVMAAASVLTSVAGGFGWATLFWALGGAGSAVVFASLYSYMLKAVPKEQMARTFGIFYATFNIGVIAGGPIGGLVAHRFGLRSPFIVYGALLATASLLCAAFVERPQPEVARDASQKEPLRGGRARALLVNPAFLSACAANFAYLWFVAAVFDMLVPLLAREKLAMSISGIGLLIAIVTAAELAVLYPAGTWADRRGRRAVLVPSLGALALTTAFVGISTGPVVLAAMLAVVGLASGIAGVPPAAMLSDVSMDEGAGTAVGIFRFVGDLGFVLGPVIAGAAAGSLGFGLAFAIAAVPAALAMAVALWAPESLKLAPSHQGRQC
jgi:MFS transporter, ACDE family, multidrug resistance protein